MSWTRRGRVAALPRVVDLIGIEGRMWADFTLRGGQLSMGLESGHGPAESFDSDGNDPHEMSHCSTTTTSSCPPPVDSSADETGGSRTAPPTFGSVEASGHKRLEKRQKMAQPVDCGEFRGPVHRPVKCRSYSNMKPMEKWKLVAAVELIWMGNYTAIPARTIRKVVPQSENVHTAPDLWAAIWILLIYLCERRVARRQTRDGWTFSDGLICKWAAGSRTSSATIVSSEMANQMAPSTSRKCVSLLVHELWAPINFHCVAVWRPFCCSVSFACQEAPSFGRQRLNFDGRAHKNRLTVIHRCWFSFMTYQWPPLLFLLAKCFHFNGKRNAFWKKN